jgi:integrase
MSVKVRERLLSSGETAFYLDIYDKNHGRFSIKTGLRENTKNRKAYNIVKANALDRARQIEKDLQFDAAAVFSRRAMSGADFVEFFRSLTAKKNYAIEANTLKQVIAFGGPVIPFDALNSGWLEQFKNHLMNCDTISQNTASGYLGVLKTAIRRGWKAGYIREDFTGKVDGIKKTDIHRHFCTIEDIEMLNKTVCKNGMVKLAFLFSCFSGLRLSDVELLTWQQISIVNGSPFIQYKQKKTSQYEHSPLSEQAVSILENVKKLHPEFAPDGSDKVFILPDRRLMGDILFVWGRDAGLSWRLHFHAARHSMACLMLSAGSDLYSVGKQLGHRSMATTQIYSRLTDKKRVAEVQRLPMLSPVNEPQPVASLPSVIVSKPEQILQPQPVLAAYPGSIVDALQAKGEKIAKALSLPLSASGKYEFNGQEFTASELALEV